MFQCHYLISAFKALENVMMPHAGGPERDPDREMEQRASEFLELVGLFKWYSNRATNMSGGQQQRVAIARALAMDPPLILADEPTGNLDTASADGVFEMMRRFNRERGTTFTVVTHNLDLAKRCDRTVQVVDERIAGEAKTLVISQRRPW